VREPTLELRRYCEARGWRATEYVDTGISGAKDRRPSLDALLTDAKRRRFDVLVCWRLDRLGRNLRHLVTMLEELNHVGVAFVSLGEDIDCTTPAGKLQLHILAALAEFERERIRERVVAGLRRAKAQGTRLGRPKTTLRHYVFFSNSPICRCNWPLNAFVCRVRHSNDGEGWFAVCRAESGCQDRAFRSYLAELPCATLFRSEALRLRYPLRGPQ